MSSKFAVGIKGEGLPSHIAIEAEDALIAALIAKHRHPEATITYVRKHNERGDQRHPPDSDE